MRAEIVVLLTLFLHPLVWGHDTNEVHDENVLSDGTPVGGYYPASINVPLWEVGAFFLVLAVFAFAMGAFTNRGHT